MQAWTQKNRNGEVKNVNGSINLLKTDYCTVIGINSKQNFLQIFNLKNLEEFFEILDKRHLILSVMVDDNILEIVERNL